MTAADFAPVAPQQRNDLLDILRGFAILGIFYMNIPYMGQALNLFENDIRSIGWTAADRTAYAAIESMLEGTQRGILQLLFGAGLIILAERAPTGDGQRVAARLHYRRNLWLIVFGLADIFVLLWAGDILLIYGVAALFVFPLRRLSTKWLITFGMAYAAFTAIDGALIYAGRVSIEAKADAVDTKIVRGLRLTDADRATRAAWQKIVDEPKLDKLESRKLATERAARATSASFVAYAGFHWNEWLTLAGDGFVVRWIFEAWCTMLLGMALWKTGFLQGLQPPRLYLGTMMAAYGFGLIARAIGVFGEFEFSPAPSSIWVTAEFARLATSVGHVAAINLIARSSLGAALLAPLKAAGRTAFSLYVMQQFIGLYVLFSPFGLGLWGRYSWAGLTAIATMVIVTQIIEANLWMRSFATGPLEWLWRSLVYRKRQPFRLRTRLSSRSS